MSSDAPATAALIAASAALVLSLVLLWYSIALRAAHVLDAWNRRRIRRRWWPVLAEAAVRVRLDDSEIPFHLSLGSRLIVLREWCAFRRQVRSDSGTALDALAMKLNLAAYARRRLGRGSIGIQLLAIQTLGFLRDKQSAERIDRLVRHRNVSISVTAATALVHIDPDYAIRRLMRDFVKRRDWPRTQVGRILNIAGPKIVSPALCKAIKSASTEDAVFLLQFYESARLHDIDSLAATLLIRRTEPRIIAAALRVVRGELPLNMIIRFTRHKTWYVRLQAASLLGRLCHREHLPHLEPMLCDPEWWVRYRAAQAIVGIPSLDPAALQAVLDRQEDRFAADIMRQTMFEASLS